MSIRYKQRIERPYWVFSTPRTTYDRNETIGKYLQELKQEKTKLEKNSWDMRNLISDDLFKDMKRAVDDEIEYCEFYFEMRKKKKDPNFKKWVKIEDFKPYYSSTKTEAWVNFNGKIKIIIFFEKTTASTKVLYRIDNDSEFIHFSPDGRQKVLNTKILRSEESIQKYVEELKEGAEGTFEEFSKPRYNEEQRNAEFLDFLLDDRKMCPYCQENDLKGEQMVCDFCHTPTTAA